MEALDKAIETLALQVREIPHSALFLAGKAFAQYRRRGGRASRYCRTSSSARMPRSRAGRY